MSRMPSARLAALATAVLAGASILAAAPAAVAVVAGSSTAVLAAPSATPVVTPAAAGIVGVPSPVRAVDTRTTSALAPGATRTVVVTGLGAIPATAKAVLVNLTAVSPTAPGFLSAFAAQSPRPTTSNVNFLKGTTVPNSALVPVGANGAISVFNGSTGSTHVIVDVQGWVAGLAGTAPGTVTTTDPTRLLDTRSTVAVPANGSVTVPVAGRAGVPATGAAAAALNFTVANPTAAGHLVAYASGTPAPGTSVENFVAGQTRAAYAVVGLGNTGGVTVANASAKPIQLVVDAFGYVAAGDPATTLAGLSVMRPNRVYDGRSVQRCNGTCVTVPDPIAAGGSRAFNATTLGVPQDASAVLLSITAVGSATPGNFSVDGGTGLTSVVNFVKATATTNTAALSLSRGVVSVLNQSAGSTFLVVDVLGWVEPQLGLSGQVDSTEGGPVAGADVLRARPNLDGSDAPELATADSTGAWSVRVTSVVGSSTQVCANGPLTPSGPSSLAWTVGCHGTYASPTLVPTAFGTQVSGIDVTLQPAGSLAFNASDVAGKPITTAQVAVAQVGGPWRASAVLNGSTTGNGQINRLPAGDYLVYLNGPTSSTPTAFGLASEWAQDVGLISNAPQADVLANGATTVHVTAGATTTPLALVADPYGRVTGTLLDSAGQRVAAGLVRAYLPSGAAAGVYGTQPDGSFSALVHPGSYLFCGTATSTSTPVCWQGNVAKANATPIAVTAQQTVPGVAITLP